MKADMEKLRQQRGHQMRLTMRHNQCVFLKIFPLPIFFKKKPPLLSVSSYILICLFNSFSARRNQNSEAIVSRHEEQSEEFLRKIEQERARQLSLLESKMAERHGEAKKKRIEPLGCC